MVYQAQEHVRKTFEQLLHLLPQSDRDKPHAIVLIGEHTGYRNDTDRELLFRQESNFFYLTGCDLPSSMLLALFQPTGNSTLHTTLFIPPIEEVDIMWSIPPPELNEAKTMFDSSVVEHTTSFSKTIRSICKLNPATCFHVLPIASPLFPKFPSDSLASFSSNNAKILDSYLLPALQRTRLIKDADEIALIKKANEISSRAHETVMRVLGLAVKNKIVRGADAGSSRPLLPGEWFIEKEAEAEAIFVASCRREGAIHQAYLPIVAASSRAATLHYCCNDKDFSWTSNPNTSTPRSDHLYFSPPHTNEIQPQVLLIDAGCEFNNYASDITRTMPVGNNGHFTSEARDIYDIVLEMQHAAFKLIKPGVHWDLVHLECHKVLIRNFLGLGLFKRTTEEPEEILQSGVSAAFFPHGLGHSLGLDVHDVPEASKPAKNETIPVESTRQNQKLLSYLRLRLPLQAGMVVTVEPGIYFHHHLVGHVRDSPFLDLEVLKRYETVGGVRIEDVVVVTQNGYDNLTTVGSERSWIEGVCSGND